VAILLLFGSVDYNPGTLEAINMLLAGKIYTEVLFCVCVCVCVCVCEC
jgi:hypothetical protein